MHEQGFDLKHLAQLISEVFVQMIFKEGFIHADPHPGNLFVRKTGPGPRDVQLVVLDHGIYTDLPKDTRLAYTKLWRGVLAQDEMMIKEASSDLGCDFHQLFASMVVNRKFEDIMDDSKKNMTKARLGEKDTPDAQKELQDYALFYH